MIHHEVADGHEPTLLFLHAAIGDGRMWEPQWQAFPDHHRIRVDFRGFGQSPPSPTEHSHVDDLIGVLDAAGVDQAVVVGGSMGGRLGLELAVTRPDRVAGLVLACAALTGHTWSDRVVAMWQAEDDALEAGDLELAIKVNLDFWLDGPDRDRSPLDTDTRALVADMQRRALEHDLVAQAGDYPAPHKVTDLHERLDQIRVPTLVTVGADDASDILEIGRTIEAGIAGAAFAMLDDAAHLPNLEQPEVFNLLLRSFLSDHVAVN